MAPALADVAVAVLAFGVGFASQRGSVCGVLAARQIVETGRISRLLAFVTASLWALVVAVPLAWLVPGRFALSSSYEGIGLAVLGGALYGLGTVINGACVFGTAARTLSGNLSFFAALPGIAAGAGLGGSLGLPQLRASQVASPLHEPSLGGMVLLLVAVAIVVVALAGTIRSHSRAGLALGQIVRAARWRTSFAMLVIGVLGGILFAAGGAWSYPSLLRQLGNLAFGRPANFATATIIGPLALVAGGIIAALAGGRFALRAPRPVQIGRSALGGAMMGLAATLIPGGNDSLLLSAAPSLATHAPPALFTMLAVQVALLSIAKRWKDRVARAWSARVKDDTPAPTAG